MKNKKVYFILILLSSFMFTYCETAQKKADQKLKADQYAECKSNLDKLNKQITAQKAEAEKKQKKNDETYKKLLASLKDEIKKDEVMISNYKDALTINIAERILFDPGKADVNPKYFPVLDKVGGVIKNLTDKFIQIEGHTDDVPIAEEYKWKIPNNWALGARRAINVTTYLMEKYKLDPQKIGVMSFSKYRPLVPNNSEKNRAKNRRIEIVILDASLFQQMEIKHEVPK